jgi:hypothetical protein
VVAEGVWEVSRWGLLALIVLVLFAPGFLLWLPPCAPPDRSSDLGTALIGGGVVAIAVLLLERSFAKETARRDLLLQLSQAEELRGIDLSGEDLSDFYLPQKVLAHSRFRKANLKGANLSGAQLAFADLREADLRDAKLDATGLWPKETQFPSDEPFPRPYIPDANLESVSLQGAAYSPETTWPQDWGSAH